MNRLIKIAAFFVLYCCVSFAQAPLPVVVDGSPDFTHKSQHERTVYSKTVDGKQVPCGTLAEFRSGQWKAFVVGKHSSQGFDTRAEAVKWLAFYCPVAGKAGT